MGDCFPRLNSEFEVTLRADQSNLALTSLPAAFDFLDTSARAVALLDLQNYSQCRIVVRKQTVAGSASSVIGLSYSTVNPGSAYVPGDWTLVAQASLVAVNADVDSGWISIPAAARVANIYWTGVQGGGDGAASPVVGFVKAYFR